MRELILNLITTKPKHYSVIIKRDPSMLDWITTNSLINTDHIPTLAYSAIYQLDNKCPNGNTTRFDRWSTGFVGCGPASVCKCTKDAISKGVSDTKSLYTAEIKHDQQARRELNMIAKYGVAFNGQRDSVKLKARRSKMTKLQYALVSSYEWMYNEYLINKRTAVDIGAQLELDYSTILVYCRQHGFEIRKFSNYSIIEREIGDYIKSLGVSIIENDRTIIASMELDIVIPSHKIAIEVNGLYYHSYSPHKQGNDPAVVDHYKTVHLIKTESAALTGYTLIHITDYEWHTKQDIVKSIIKSKLGMTSRIFARKCKVVYMNTASARVFFDCNHIQGFISAANYIGLSINDEIVMAISAGNSRFVADELELYRMAAMQGVTVVGGGSKLLAELNKLTNNKPIVSYCDRSRSNGNGYVAMGFSLRSISKPGYKWVTGNEVISRNKCTKPQLASWLPNYNSLLSQSENMYSAGYRCMWDCGNYVYVRSGSINKVIT